VAIDNELAVQVIVDASQFQGGMANVGQVAEKTAARINAAFDSVPATVEKAEYSFTEARHAAAGLGEEMGVHLPRLVSSFLAHSELIGPALAAAFTPVALIMVGKILAETAEKLVELYQDTYNLKSAFEQLDAIAEKLVPTQIALSNSIIKTQAELLNLSEGGVVGAKARLGELANEIVDLQSHFDTASKEFKEFPESVQEAFKAHTIFPAKEIGSQIREVESELTHLKRAQKQLTDNPQTEIFGKGALQNTKAQIQAYTELLDLLVLEQTDLGARTALATEQLHKQLEQFSKSGGAQAEKTLKLQIVPPDFSKMTVGLQLAESTVKSNLDALKQVGPTSEQVYTKMADDAVAAYKEIQKSSEDQLRDSLKAADLALKAANERYEGEYHAGILSATQLAAARQKALDADFQAERNALLQRINTLAPKEIDARRKVDEQLTELDRKHAEESRTIAQKLADDQIKAGQKMEKALSEINKPFEKALDGIIMGTERVDVAFRKMGAEIVSSITKSLAMAAMKWAEHWVLLELLTVAGNASIAAAQGLANSKKVFSDAYTAAANAYAAVPFPLNLVAAPAVFTLVAALGSGAASAAGGMVVPEDMMAMIHENEVVLPAAIAKRFTDAAPGSGAGGENHVHIHIHALDAKGMRSWINRGGGSEINRHLKKTFRSMGGTSR
jgi:archaellum component FlaC